MAETNLEGKAKKLKALPFSEFTFKFIYKYVIDYRKSPMIWATIQYVGVEHSYSVLGFCGQLMNSSSTNASFFPWQKGRGNSKFVDFVWTLSNDKKKCLHVCPNLLLGDVQDAFQGQLFEIKAITLVKVSADCLRVVVHHHCLLAHLSQGSDARHCTPVKLNTAPWRITPLINLSTLDITNSMIMIH